jgi:starch synthase
VIRNGIDTDEYAPDTGTDVLDKHGIDPGRPTIAYVGRVTRRRGCRRCGPPRCSTRRFSWCFALNQADTPELGAEVPAWSRAWEGRSGVIWLNEMLPKAEVIQIRATQRSSPAVLYEPLGIVNLEAGMRHAGRRSRVGGIPEVVLDAQTGLLVPPGDHVLLAEALASLVGDQARAAALGELGREHVAAEFSWASIAAQTAALYTDLVRHAGTPHDAGDA